MPLLTIIIEILISSNSQRTDLRPKASCFNTLITGRFLNEKVNLFFMFNTNTFWRLYYVVIRPVNACGSSKEINISSWKKTVIECYLNIDSQVISTKNKTMQNSTYK